MTTQGGQKLSGQWQGLLGESLLDQYQHRIVSAEIALQDFHRYGLLGRGDYSKRLNQLRRLTKELDRVRVVRSFEEKAATNQGVDVGLPIPSNASPAEIKIVESFLDAKKRFAQDLLKQAALGLKWIHIILNGGMNFKIFLHWRLSKLRRKIHAIEMHIFRSDREEKRLNQIMQGLGSKLQTKFGRALDSSGFEALLEVYRDIDNGTSRIANLRATIRAEESRISRMITWLEKEESRMQGPLPSFAPPTPFGLAMAECSALNGYGMETNEITRRLVLARTYWDSCLASDKRSKELPPLPKLPHKYVEGYGYNRTSGSRRKPFRSSVWDDAEVIDAY